MTDKLEKKPEYIYESTLIKERGWTKSLIEKFLVKPDKLVTNPHYRSGPESKLYLIERVIPFEQTKEFLDKQIGRDKRKFAASKAVKTKLDKITEYLKSVQIEIQQEPLNKVYQAAIAHYNDFQESRNREENTINQSYKKLDKGFLNRITVNFLRHQLTNYEDELDEVSGKTGKWIAYEEIKSKVYNKIAEAYPALKNECNRQNNNEE